MSPALIVSIVAVTFTILNFCMTFVLVPWRENRREFRRAQKEVISTTLEELLSAPVAGARNAIGFGARSGPGKTKPLKDVPHDARTRTLEMNRHLLDMRSATIGAAFTAMWHLELVHLRLSRVAREREAVSRDVVSLYRHVDLIARELDSLLVTWSGIFDADQTVAEVNKALDGLPALIDESTGQKVLPTSTRLPMGKTARSRMKGQS